MATLPSYEFALALAKKAVLGVLGDSNPAHAPARRRRLILASGGTVAESLLADRDLPPFDRVTMDGYAVRLSDARPGARLRVTGSVSAGAPPIAQIRDGECLAVATGAVMPSGGEVVVPYELTDRAAPLVTLSCPEGMVSFQNVHRRGSDARAGEVLIAEGQILDPTRVAIAAAIGAHRPLICGGTPSIRVLSSGDEIRAASTSTQDLQPFQIRDSNAHALEAMLPSFGGRIEGVRHCPDEADATIAALKEGVAEADIVVTIGGVSAGPRDHFPAALAALRVETIFQGVNMQPGKPVLMGLGRTEAPTGAGRAAWRPIVIGLPGNPVSVVATAHLFLWPLVQLLSGASGNLPWEARGLAESVQPNAKREAFRPAQRMSDGQVRVIPWHGSGDFVHLGLCDGLVRLAASESKVQEGARVPFLPWAWSGRRP